MLQNIDPTYIVYALAAGSAMLFVEAIYLSFFSATSYRNRINRRLRLMDGQPDRESILVQLRRERGLTSGGLYSLPSVSLNRLVLQSGLTLGVNQLLMVAAGASVAVFFAAWWYREDVVDAVLIAAASLVLLPFVTLRFMRGRRH